MQSFSELLHYIREKRLILQHHKYRMNSITIELVVFVSVVAKIQA